MNKFKSKLAVLGGALASSVCAFAEGEVGGQQVDASLVTQYITDGKQEIVTVLTAGAAIVGAFFVWGLIKKALNRSK